jgi:hypothetical protein
MRRRSFVAATGTALATVGLAGCTGDGTDDGTEPGTADTETTADSTDTETSDGEFDPDSAEGSLGEVSENVEVTEHGFFEESDELGVGGVVENVSGDPLEYVEVEVTLNDGDTIIGEFVDTSDEERDYLAAGEQWDFRTTFDDEQLTANTSYTIDVEAEISDDVTDGTGNETTSGGN